MNLKPQSGSTQSQSKSERIITAHAIYAQPSCRRVNPNRPMFVTGLVAACLMLLLVLANPVTRYFVPRLEPNISFETEGERPSVAASRTQMTTREAGVFDGEVYRTEGRLREMSVLAIAAYSAVLDGHFHGRSPSSVERLLATVDRTPLARIGLEALPDGTGFTSEHNIFHVRFRPRLLNVEIIATPRTRNDGPALLIRVPETDAYDLPPGRLRYFESQRLDDVRIPAPFATSAQIQADGWQSQIMNSQLPVDVAPDRLMRWAQDQSRQRNSSQSKSSLGNSSQASK